MLVFAGLCVAPGFAGQTEIGLDIDFTHGDHAETNVRYDFPLIPLPVFHVRHRERNFELAFEAIPPIGPVGYATGSGYLPQSTRLSYLVGSLRYYLSGSRFYGGVGASVLNQRTTASTLTPTDGFNAIQSSRVSGVRYELGYRSQLKNGRVLDASLSANPRLTAILYFQENGFDTVTLANGAPSVENFASGGQAQERGAQVEGVLRMSTPYRGGTFSYGVRYINFIAVFAATNQLADRNTFFMPFVGISRTIGK